MNTTDRDINAYRVWTTHRLTPAYMRGIPTSVWQSALCKRRLRPAHADQPPLQPRRNP